jgi:hypothetical protein
MVEFENFDLEIVGSTPPNYVARVLRSPSGEGEVSFVLPFSSLELENMCPV